MPVSARQLPVLMPGALDEGRPSKLRVEASFARWRRCGNRPASNSLHLSPAHHTRADLFRSRSAESTNPNLCLRHHVSNASYLYVRKSDISPPSLAAPRPLLRLMIYAGTEGFSPLVQRTVACYGRSHPCYVGTRSDAAIAAGKFSGST